MHDHPLKAKLSTRASLSTKENCEINPSILSWNI